METHDKVSIIIPCYNQGSFLRDNLNYLQNSSHKNIEILIINDGSNDIETLDILKVIECEYPRLNIKIISQNNQGLSSARNLGVKHASGEYIQFLDADDIILNDKLRIQLEHFKSDPALQIVISDYLFGSHDLTNYSMAAPSTIADHTFNTKTFLLHWEKTLSIPIHCGLFRKKLLQEIPFKTNFHAKEDWIFWTQISNRLNPINFLYHQDELAIYRVHSNSMTKRDHSKMLNEWIKAQSLLLTLFGSTLTNHELYQLLDTNSYHVQRSYLNQIKESASVKNKIKTLLRRSPLLYLLASKTFHIVRVLRRYLAIGDFFRVNKKTDNEIK